MSRRQLVGAAGTAALVTGIGMVVALATGFLRVVVTHGTSMLPRFHSGDLALVWASGGYHVGQVVAYWSPVLHTTVLHRVVGERNGLFTFKGDNNSFVDPVRLPASDIKGSLLLHVPQAGAWLRWSKSPPHLAVVVALAVLLCAAAPATARHRERRRAKGEVEPTRPMPKAPNLSHAAVPLGVALLFAAAGVVAWSRPELRQGSQPVPYREEVNFSYQSAVPPDLPYPQGEVSTGEPVFLNLVDALTVSARYSFSTAAPHFQIRGTMGGTVSLVYGTGWSTLLQRLPNVALRGSRATVSSTVNLSNMSRVLEEANKETGVDAAAPTLVISPTITSKGTIDGVPFEASFDPALSFDFDSAEVDLIAQQGPNGTWGFPQLSQAKNGSVQRPVPEPATLSFLGHPARVSTVRDIGALGLLASLVLAAAMASWGRRRPAEDAAKIEARYGPVLVAVHTTPEDGIRSVVDMLEMAALAKVAETYGAVILAHSNEGAHTYYVDGGQTLYRYRPGAHKKHEPRRRPRERAYEPRHRAGGEQAAGPRLARPPIAVPWLGRVARLDEDEVAVEKPAEPVK